MIHHRVDQLDLNLLKVFEAVYREKHLGRAAAMLFLTPSAVSHAMRRLREHLGDPLFVRDGRCMRPTPVCARMAPELLEELANLRSLLQRWGVFEPAKSRQHFRLAMPDAIEVMLLPDLVKLLAEEAPNTSLTTAHLDRRDMVSSLAGNVLDVAIDVAVPIDSDLQFQPLFHDQMCLVTRKDHALAQKMTAKRYLNAEHIAVSSRAAGTVIEDASLAKLGLTRKVALRCQNYHSAVAIAESSDFALTIPLALARTITAGKGLVISKLPFELPSVDLNLYWHSDMENDAANVWFRKLILDHFSLSDVFQP
ncbi:LysR family transcriptional regulator [Amylibacter sp. SFDW26]|uniref:LysR family transcriptional regulator n=1 Tax=Amylibacter sp. SFDW26 TaxID=2652722 RepID=UPI001D01C29E|nr:LysR family transcriptional regulator [Amylibacter sp. SFDW26]